MLNAYLEVSQLKILVISLLTPSETRFLRSVKALMKMPRKTESVILLSLIPVIADLFNLNRFLKRKWINWSLIHLPSPVNWTVFQPCLMKTHINAFISFITHVINCSFTSAVFPKYLGGALITPVLKKPSLDSNDFSNCRPVLNINFISTIHSVTSPYTHCILIHEARTTCIYDRTILNFAQVCKYYLDKLPDKLKLFLIYC